MGNLCQKKLSKFKHFFITTRTLRRKNGFSLECFFGVSRVSFQKFTPAEFQGEEELVFSEKALQLLVLEHAESKRQLAALEVEGEGLRDAGVPLVYAEHAAERLRG